jgi:5,5'-dehydrodivanillate O-demethylase oxygenase subunit
MVLTKQENLRISQLGPGTPLGNLMRRYWYPVIPAAELTAERPKKRIRLLGEDLVIYLDPAADSVSAIPTYGCVAEKCSHRGCSLYYGFLEDGGIRCAYHGWLYDNTGKVLEQPFEPEQSMLKYTVQQAAYPVQRMAGLLFVYMGPTPAPLLPRYDVWAREDGTHEINVQPIIETNILQAQENSLDPTHVYYLHGHQLVQKGINKKNNYRKIEGYEFELIPNGILKRRIFGGDGHDTYKEPGHAGVFPAILRHHGEGRNGANPFDGTMPIDMHLRVPIDDTHLQVMNLQFNPSPDGSITDPRTEEVPVKYHPSLMTPDGSEFHVSDYPSQDSMAWVTQGGIADRTIEHLGAGDEGIAMWRRMIEENIAIVEEGGDPINVFREEHDVIEFSPARVKQGDKYVPRDTEAARSWKEYLPGSRDAYLAGADIRNAEEVAITRG